MRKLIATVFNYFLLDGLADEGTSASSASTCPEKPRARRPGTPIFQSAYAHIMGRTAYEAIAGSMTTSTDHPFSPHPERRAQGRLLPTLKTADWANTTIAAGDTAEETMPRSSEAATATSWSGAASASGGRSRPRPDRRAPAELVPLRCGRGDPAVRRRPRVLPARPGLQHRLQQWDPRVAVSAAPLTQRLAALAQKAAKDSNLQPFGMKRSGGSR